VLLKLEIAALVVHIASQRLRMGAPTVRPYKINAQDVEVNSTLLLIVIRLPACEQVDRQHAEQKASDVRPPGNAAGTGTIQ